MSLLLFYPLPLIARYVVSPLGDMTPDTRKAAPFRTASYPICHFSTDYTVANAKGGWQGVFRVSVIKRKQYCSALTHLLNQMMICGF